MKEPQPANPKACRACGTKGLQPIFEIGRVPVHSVLTLRSREEAQTFPTGDICLSVCPSCGLIQNDLFDPTTQRFGPEYEETQGFSPRFREFQEALASRLVARHNLRGRHVLEIGCGKGDFLRLLCRLGPNTGIGLDPAWVPRGEPQPGAEFLALRYGPEHAHITPDFICCNMTLEHIGDPLNFLRAIRANLGARERAAVFMMVPDVARILREAAFWDIYYEHCNYFTRGSLASLFARSGFDALWLGLEFEGQYLAIEGQPTEGEGRIVINGAEPADAVVRSASDFGVRASRSVRAWRATLARWHAGGHRIVVWGGGSKAVAFLGAVATEDCPIHAVVDVNPHRQGTWLPGVGVRIDPPEALRRIGPSAVIAMNPAYRNEIQERLAGFGLRPEILALGQDTPS